MVDCITAAWQHAAAAVECRGLSLQQRDWLTYSGSLTRRLQQKFPDNICLRLLREGVDSIHQEESELLNADCQHQHWVREIAWHAKGKQQQPWIIARVVIPNESTGAEFQQLRHIGNRSIGELLFQSDDFVAGHIEFAQIPTGHPYYLIGISQQPLWARRRIFTCGAHQLLVSELFLPAFFSGVVQHD